MKIEPGFTRPALHRLFCERGYLVGAEIGVQAGIHAVQILTAWPGVLYLIDPWKHYDHGAYVDLANVPDAEQEAYRKACLEAVAPFGNRARIVRLFSDEAAPGFEDGSLDFVYIDADHRYRSTLQDLELWYPKVRAGGLVSGHDYTQDNDDPEAGCFGVKAAVNRFAEGKTDTLFVSQEDWPTWAFFKRQS